MRGHISQQVAIVARGLWRMLPPAVRSRFWGYFDSAVPYQKIIYKGKVLMRGHDRTSAYQVLFPSPPIGKTILDVGCHTGFFCFMAASNGGEYCMGIDIERSRIRKGQALAAKAGVTNIELIAADIFKYEPRRRFDVVLCLNLLQHTGTLDRANQLLDKLYLLADARLALIVPLPDTPGMMVEYAIRGKIKYLLLSEQYFRNRYQADDVRCIPIACYGLNRAAILINKAAPSSVPSK